MRRRAYLTGALGLALAATAVVTSPSYCRMLSSARNFEHYFHELKAADSVGPIERFVFSLGLARVSSEQKSAVPRR